MSCWTAASSPARSAVTAPTTIVRFSTAGAASNIGYARKTRNTPAATIVAAWMSADAGVGPAIASGSHTCSGTCADLPIAPKSSISATAAAVPGAQCAAPPRTVSYENVPAAANMMNRPIMNPMSPTRVVMNAFIEALRGASCSCQNPMSRYEQRPISSHEMNSSKKLSARTSSSIAAVNSESTA